MPDNPTTPPADGQSGTGPTGIPAARATSNGHVPTLRRFRGDYHCPICGGADDDRRGRGDRCFGFLSGDGAFAHCTRDECAGGIPLTPTSLTYPHRLKGPCRCGKEHGPADPKPSQAKARRGGQTTRGRIVATYDYRDADGTLLFQVVRYEPKAFVQRRPSGKGGWLWGLDGVEPVLYRLPELLAADPAQVVLMPEGEKDVDRLRGLGLVATCNPMGAGKWRDSYSAALRGRHVALLADNDRPGRDHAFAVPRSVAPWAASVKVVELPGLPEKGDVSDFLDRGGTKEDLLALVEAAPAWTPSAGPSADGRAAAPTPDPGDVAALRERAGEFQKLSDLTDDVGWLDALARLEVTDPDEANRILTFAQDVLGKKKWAAKPVKIALAGPRKAARRLDAPRETPRAGRPEILVDRPIHEVIADAVAALAGDPEVFQRGPNLVRMIRNEKPPKGLKGTEGTPQIAPIPATRLIELLSRSARWVRERMNNDGEPILIATDPTGLHASLVKDRCDWPGIRVLERVTEAPCLRPDGTLLQTPGYDPDTGLFFLPHPGVTFPEIPEHPTIEDARAAAQRLLDLVVDFPFARPEGTEEEDSPHTYAWLASLLTILCRSAIDGPCPLFLFTANTAGSGKTKLCDLSALIATGRKMPRSDYTDNNEEMAKVLFAIALGGFPVVFLDNVGSGGALGGSAIDKALTSTALNGRLLGASEMRDVPFHAVLFATGNNVRLQGDIHRRIIPCRLESPDEHPEERDNFAIKDLEGHVRRNRPALVTAGLTIVRAYVVAGGPDQELTPMDFPAWSHLIRNAIHWATGVDPCATRAEARDDDDSATELARLIPEWEALCKGEGKDALSPAEALKAVKPDPITRCSRYDELYELFVGMTKRGDLPTSGALGTRLGKHRGKVIRTEDGLKALHRIKIRGTRLWFVKSIAPREAPSQGARGARGAPKSRYPVTKTDFSLPQTTVIDEEEGEKKTSFRGDEQGSTCPTCPTCPPEPDAPLPAGLTEPPCGGCWRMDCPWCTPSDDDASEGGAR